MGDQNFFGWSEEEGPEFFFIIPLLKGGTRIFSIFSVWGDQNFFNFVRSEDQNFLTFIRGGPVFYYGQRGGWKKLVMAPST